MFLFFKIWFWIGQYEPFQTIIDKFYSVFKECCCLWVLSPRIWNMLWMHFSKMNFRHQLKKNGEMTYRYQKISGFFLVENILSPNIWDCPLNPTLNTWYKRLLSGWLRGIASVPYHPLRVCFGSNTIKLFFFYHFLWFF